MSWNLVGVMLQMEHNDMGGINVSPGLSREQSGLDCTQGLMSSHGS